MRSIIVAAVVLGLCGSAVADDAHTRQVVSRHASEGRKHRVTAGVLSIALGAALGVGGYYAIKTAEPGGFVDFSPLQKGVGYIGMVSGGLLLVTGPIVLMSRSEQEKMRDQLAEHGDAARTRSQIARLAAEGRRVRRQIRIVAGVTALVGLAGAGTGIAIGDDVGTATAVMGFGLVVVSGGFLAASLAKTPFEVMERDLARPQAPALTAGLVPLRGGALVGIGGAF